MEHHSNYKGVTKVVHANQFNERSNHKPWMARHTEAKSDRKWSSRHKTEREAAIAYDKKMIELGRPPVNILNPVTP